MDAENINYRIFEEFKLPHRTGLVYPLIVGNKVFTGNSAGGLDSYLGFGQFNAINMGVSAAKWISGGENYERQISDILKRNLQLRQLRKVFNRLKNKDYDNIVAAIGMPGIKQFMYDSNINIAKIGAALSRMFLKK